MLGLKKKQAAAQKAREEAAAKAQAEKAASSGSSGDAKADKDKAEKGDGVWSMSGASSRRRNAAQLRAQRDLDDVEDTPGARMEFPDPDDIMNFKVFINPQEGRYKDAIFEFTVQVGKNYPIEPPKVLCKTLVFHPNIDWQGNVCLNILREDWRPVLSLSSVIFGILNLFLEPNPDDPLNKEAAKMMIDNEAEFTRKVRATLRGGQHFSRHFPKLV